MLKMWRSEIAYRLMVKFVGGFFVFGVLLCSVVDSDAIGAESKPLFNVGYQVLDLKYRKDGQDTTLTVAVWYPTLVQSKSHHYGGPTSGNIAVDAEPYTAGGPYPLLVFSHGYGGGGIGAVFFNEALASRGWIVACPDHHDKHPAVRIRTGQQDYFDRLGFLYYAKGIADSDPSSRGQYLYRLDEMKFVLDGVLTSGPFAKLIDSDRVAVGGHSFGGFTALGLTGTIDKFYDPRIKAVLLFSTGSCGYLFTEKELAAVRIPSMLFMGEREKDEQRGSGTMAELSAKIYRNLASPKYFLVVKGAGHFSFNNAFKDKRSIMRLSGTEEEFDVIRRYSIAFLEKHVAGRTDSGCVLERSDPMLTSYTTEPVPAVSKKIRVP